MFDGGRKIASITSRLGQAGGGLLRNTEVTQTYSRVFLPASSQSRFSSGNGFSTVPSHLPAEVAGTAAMPRWAAA